MRIGLIDVDGHNFPNLCLMKLSGWHKAQGDDVEWWREDAPDYDIVYMAKVFSDTYSPDKPTPQNAKKVVRGGDGIRDLAGGREIGLSQGIRSSASSRSRKLLSRLQPLS